MITSSSLEPGGIYTDHNGQRRMVLKSMRHLVKFVLVSHGKGHREIKLHPGDAKWMSRAAFCDWASGVAA